MVPGANVHVYESMKLRLLNGTHSAMACDSAGTQILSKSIPSSANYSAL